MSKLAASKAAHPELRRFARRVVDERSSEKERFISWLLAMYGDDGVPQVTPFAADRQVADYLDGVCCSDFEIRYVLAMIEHDAGALAIANAAKGTSLHGRIDQAALDVAAERAAEISQLRQWLYCWYGINASVAAPRVKC